MHSISNAAVLHQSCLTSCASRSWNYTFGILTSYLYLFIISLITKDNECTDEAPHRTQHIILVPFVVSVL